MAKAKDRWHVPDPNKAGDLNDSASAHCCASSRRLTRVQTEAPQGISSGAVRGGSKGRQERDYSTIIAVGRQDPENVLQEDPKLLMWYDQALTRMGGNA